MNFGDNWENKKQDEQIVELPLNELRVNPYQPRIYFDEDALLELASSIEQVGVFQPIIVRKSSIKGYEIIAGERRFRASKLAKKETIPAIIRQITDEEMMQIAVLENLQRENLTPLEEAKSYQTLMDKLQLTQQEVAVKVGKSRPYIANFLRLLQLPAEISKKLEAKELTVGQVRPLIALDNADEQIEIAKKIQEGQWTVRDVENYVQQNKEKRKQKKRRKSNTSYEEIERQLEDKFGTIVNVIGEEKGRVEFRFLSSDDLMHLLDKWDIKID